MGSSKTAGFPFHPFLIAAAPVLALLAHNTGQARLTEGLRPLGISLLICALLLVLLWRWTGNVFKAGVATTLSLVVLLSYGHVYDALKDLAPALAPIIRHRYLLPAVGALWLLILILVWRMKRAEPVTTFLNCFALVAFAFPAFQILTSQASALVTGSSPGQAGEECSSPFRPGSPPGTST